MWYNGCILIVGEIFACIRRKERPQMNREAGVLLHISSLPSKYGIGCFSKEAYDFVDWLKEAGQTYWQILPVGPTSYGDSPYQSFSTFAGNPYFISLEALIEEGVLTAEECDAVDFGDNASDIDYAKMYENRYPLKTYQIYANRHYSCRFCVKTAFYRQA